jgi:hypothetical protein
MLDSKNYPPVPKTEGPDLNDDDGPVDLIHVGTIDRRQNKTPCRFLKRSVSSTDVCGVAGRASAVAYPFHVYVGP